MSYLKDIEEAFTNAIIAKGYEGDFRNFRYRVNSDNEKVFVPVKDIDWIDAAGDYMCIHTEAENFIVRTTMKSLAAELDDKMFCRIHKSTLVNIHSNLLMNYGSCRPPGHFTVANTLTMAI